MRKASLVEEQKMRGCRLAAFITSIAHIRQAVHTKSRLLETGRIRESVVTAITGEASRFNAEKERLDPSMFDRGAVSASTGSARVCPTRDCDGRHDHENASGEAMTCGLTDAPEALSKRQIEASPGKGVKTSCLAPGRLDPEGEFREPIGGPDLPLGDPRRPATGPAVRSR